MSKNNGSPTYSELKFHFGDYTFESNSYEFKVSSNDVKAAIRGYGSLNDSGNYRFWASIADGSNDSNSSIDKFRIRIWDMAGGNSVLYDNYVLFDNSKSFQSTWVNDGNIIIKTK